MANPRVTKIVPGAAGKPGIYATNFAPADYPESGELLKAPIGSLVLQYADLIDCEQSCIVGLWQKACASDCDSAAWVSAGGGAGALSQSGYTHTSSNFTIVPSNLAHGTILVDSSAGPVNVILGTPGANTVFYIKQVNAGGSAITLIPATGAIDNAATHVFGGTMGLAGQARRVIYDGFNWWIT